MRRLEYFVPGQPKGQPRPRATGRGGFVRMYNPPSADDWKASVVSSTKAVFGKDREQITTAAEMSFTFQFNTPRRAPAHSPRTSKPDIDNLIKSTLDAIVASGVIKDDSLVYTIRATKQHDSNPGCLVIVRW